MATEAHGLAKLAPFGRKAVGAKYSGFSQGLLLIKAAFADSFFAAGARARRARLSMKPTHWMKDEVRQRELATALSRQRCERE